MKANLKQVRILVADHDSNLGSLLVQVLQRMGFPQAYLVRDGESAIRALQAAPPDILITEWQLQHMDGLKLTSHIRQSQKATEKLLPIIMATARAERQDVEAARDAGITEFVVKPYNSVTVFKRIQQVIDNPRPFLIAGTYVGPDRRRRNAEVAGDRRVKTPAVVGVEATQSDDGTPKVVMPEFIIKKRAGLNEPLDVIITPKVLSEAQTVIDNLKDASLVWIQQYLSVADKEYKRLLQNPSQVPLDAIMEALLSIKSNAGMFGYVTTAQMAQQLYQFLRFDYRFSDSRHNQVLLKHIQGLTLLLGAKAQGEAMDKEMGLLQGLNMMIAKFKHA